MRRLHDSSCIKHDFQCNCDDIFDISGPWATQSGSSCIFECVNRMLPSQLRRLSSSQIRVPSSPIDMKKKDHGLDFGTLELLRGTDGVGGSVATSFLLFSIRTSYLGGGSVELSDLTTKLTVYFKRDSSFRTQTINSRFSSFFAPYARADCKYLFVHIF